MTKIARPCYSKLIPTQNVNLTPKLDRFVKNAVRTGEYNNASEVHRAALSAMARNVEERELRLDRLRHEIQVGLDWGTASKITSIDAFLDDCTEEALGEIQARR